ncbi:hypothetical protein H3Z85_22440 [Chryseobacterium indologenes]|uniref:hypothetical protein n=1 Tax=Chryseobacterium TaxID=59732 RepID=UPI0003E05F65|nr:MULTISPECIES: hypothetical protein [Chryseobacterium]ASE61931.1 hypothetical protein CEQ15_10750 [Chryseobacterium indologenes]AYZ35024.1 hypothetical protein EGY07_05290 [Chryseobacterium indologenes]MBF6643771.1 hypothetical protein [Chryseobacterium indologenes]MEB4761680.1 hypothetical protein [Chryseobacterium indologenes]QPQ51904.1 hypothetical protein H3Z85_22440 [Chryseobacterium indologenes]
MGIKIKFLLLVLILPIGVFSQNKVTNLKKLAFNYCLVGNYSAIDSAFYNKFKDASATQIAIDGNFFENEELTTKINNFTTSQTSKYYSRDNNLHFESGNKNIIFCDCLSFYESKELDNYVRKLIGSASQRKSSKK